MELEEEIWNFSYSIVEYAQPKFETDNQGSLMKCRIGFGEMYIFLESTRRDKFNGIHHCRPD